MHLPADADGGNAAGGIGDRIEHLARRLHDPGPPAVHGLLGPPERRHDLLLLDRNDRQDGAARIDQRGPDAAGPDVDRQGEILACADRGHRLSQRVPYCNSMAMTMMTPMKTCWL